MPVGSGGGKISTISRKIGDCEQSNMLTKIDPNNIPCKFTNEKKTNSGCIHNKQPLIYGTSSKYCLSSFSF